MNRRMAVSPLYERFALAKQRLASARLLLTPAASGYFMARSAIGWQRLKIVEPLKGPGAAG
jgi:hypothetical protein